MTKKTNSQEKTTLLTNEQKQRQPLPNELDPNANNAHVKIAFAANKMKARLSSNKGRI